MLREKSTGLSASRVAQQAQPLHLAAIAKSYAHTEAAALVIKQAADTVDGYAPFFAFLGLFQLASPVH